MNKLPVPPAEAIVFEDDRVYVCLASFPITPGHTIVVWKETVADLHLLTRNNYEYLMRVVGQTRNALMKALKVEKVYLIYMDEINQVHWHLVPRYNQQGFNLLNHEPKAIDEFPLAKRIREYFH